MCDQFYERLGKNVAIMSGSSCVEIRKVYSKLKLAWILMNFENNDDSQKIWRQMLRPYNGDIAVRKIEIRHSNDSNDSNNDKSMVKKRIIETIETVSLSWEYITTMNRWVFRTSDGNEFYCLTGFLSVVMPENIRELFGLCEKVSERKYCYEKRREYENHEECIRNDDLKKALTLEQIEMCELNQVFGPVIKIHDDWISEEKPI